MRVRDSIGPGESYRVWSYVPDPTPATLTAARAAYPAEVGTVLGDRRPNIFRRSRIPTAKAHRASAVRRPVLRAFCPSSSYVRGCAPDRGKRAIPPYAAVLALESWFRQRAASDTTSRRHSKSHRSSSSSPGPKRGTATLRRSHGRDAPDARHPRTRRGGLHEWTNDDGTWVVTDHDAHAWVEVWFAVSDGSRSIRLRAAGASEVVFVCIDSATAIAALSQGELTNRVARSRTGDRTSATSGRRDGRGVAPPCSSASCSYWRRSGSPWSDRQDGARRTRYLSRDPRRIGTASRRELEGFLRDQGASVPRGATLVTLQDPSTASSGSTGGRSRSRPPVRGSARRTPSTGVRRQRGRSFAGSPLGAQRLSLWARFRGFVSLRSLRSAGTP